ncbi:periplasmic binding protein-like II [Neocallimastix lanati (nom. inval.)]|nr:periplasmic binding protein-like II [Neocallimastix sp. JGI-2020a]
MNKKSDKYDIYMFDNIYLNQYGDDLMNLQERIPNNILNNFNNSITKSLCVKKGKLLCLPFYFNFGVLYSNKKLLDKYDKKPPKTWNELMDIAKYILDMEKNENKNKNLIGYMGHMPDFETSVCSSLEVLYSFRDNFNDTFPSFKSSEAKAAFDTIKNLKDNISDDNSFRVSDYPILLALLSQQVIFARYWDNIIPSMDYYITHLPGNKEGISASCINSLNVGINKHSDIEKQIAARKVFEFLFSEEIQKDILIKFKKNVGLKKLYEDEEVCQILENDIISISCNMTKNIQFFVKPIDLLENYEKYSSKYREILKSYLYEGTRSSEVALEDIYNISHIYHIEVLSAEGIAVIVSNIFLTLLMIISYLFIIQKRNKQYFKFLLNRYWLLFMVGLVTVNIYVYTGLSELSRFKCYIRPILISGGFTISFTPIVLKMIINFPLKNRISDFVHHHYFAFILIFMLIDIISFIFYSMSPLIIKTYYIEDGKNFQYCISYSKLGKSVVMGMIIYKGSILIILAFFLFLEWNIEETRNDIRSFMSILYINALSMILYVMICNVDIKNYHIYYFVRVIPIYSYTITNYLMVIGVRFQFSYMKKENEQELLEKMLFKQASYKMEIDQLNINPSPPSIKGRESSSVKRETLKSLMVNVHFSTGTSKTDANKTDDMLLSLDSPSSYVNESFLSSSYASKTLETSYKNFKTT